MALNISGRDMAAAGDARTAEPARIWRGRNGAPNEGGEMTSLGVETLATYRFAGVP